MKTRRLGYDSLKIRIILRQLYLHPEGLWLSELARKTNLNRETINKYTNKILKHLVEQQNIIVMGRLLTREITLKRGFREQLKSEQDVYDFIGKVKGFIDENRVKDTNSYKIQE